MAVYGMDITLATSNEYRYFATKDLQGIVRLEDDSVTWIEIILDKPVERIFEVKKAMRLETLKPNYKREQILDSLGHSFTGAIFFGSFFPLFMIWKTVVNTYSGPAAVRWFVLFVLFAYLTGMFCLIYLVRKYNKYEWITFYDVNGHVGLRYTVVGPDTNFCEAFTQQLVTAIKSHTLPQQSQTIRND